jgi:hypothetical protein
VLVRLHLQFVHNLLDVRHLLGQAFRFDLLVAVLGSAYGAEVVACEGLVDSGFLIGIRLVAPSDEQRTAQYECLPQQHPAT